MKTIDLTISEELLNTPICLHSYAYHGRTEYAHVSLESFKQVIDKIDSIEVVNRDERGRFCTPYILEDNGHCIDSCNPNSIFGYIDFDCRDGRYNVFPLSDIVSQDAPHEAIKAMKAELRRSGGIFWDAEANAAAIKALVACDEISAQEGLECLGYDVDEMLEEEGEIEVINHGGYTETID